MKSKTGFDKLEELTIAPGGFTCEMLKKLQGIESCRGLFCSECYENAEKAFKDIIEQAKAETFMRPCYKDGTPFEFGQKIESNCGTEFLPSFVKVYADGSMSLGNGANAFSVGGMSPHVVKHQCSIAELREKLDNDKKKGLTRYWGCSDMSCNNCTICDGKAPGEHYGVGTCQTAMGMDIMRRQNEIDALEKERSFDWDAFKRGEFVVNCRTEEAAKDFCHAMHERGMRWSNGASYDKETFWPTFEDKTCYDASGLYGSIGGYGQHPIEWKIGMGGGI